jgi:hypothetical protein
VEAASSSDLATLLRSLSLLLISPSNQPKNGSQRHLRTVRPHPRLPLRTRLHQASRGPRVEGDPSCQSPFPPLPRATRLISCVSAGLRRSHEHGSFRGRGDDLRRRPGRGNGGERRPGALPSFALSLGTVLISTMNRPSSATPTCSSSVETVSSSYVFLSSLPLLSSHLAR